MNRKESTAELHGVQPLGGSASNNPTHVGLPASLRSSPEPGRDAFHRVPLLPLRRWKARERGTGNTATPVYPLLAFGWTVAPGGSPGRGGTRPYQPLISDPWRSLRLNPSGSLTAKNAKSAERGMSPPGFGLRRRSISESPLLMRPNDGGHRKVGCWQSQSGESLCSPRRSTSVLKPRQIGASLRFLLLGSPCCL